MGLLVGHLQSTVQAEEQDRVGGGLDQGAIDLLAFSSCWWASRSSVMSRTSEYAEQFAARAAQGNVVPVAMKAQSILAKGRSGINAIAAAAHDRPDNFCESSVVLIGKQKAVYPLADDFF
jgi:hypothetical protein